MQFKIIFVFLQLHHTTDTYAVIVNYYSKIPLPTKNSPSYSYAFDFFPTL